MDISDGSHSYAKRESGGQINTVHLKEKTKQQNKHADANILSWKRSHELLSWRNVERMIGILIWDWSVANRSRSKIELVIDAAEKSAISNSRGDCGSLRTRLRKSTPYLLRVGIRGRSDAK